jgi:hypothetical protein
MTPPPVDHDRGRRPRRHWLTAAGTVSPPAAHVDHEPVRRLRQGTDPHRAGADQRAHQQPPRLPCRGVLAEPEDGRTMWRDQYEHISLARGHDWAHATARAMTANLHGVARALEKDPLGAPQATTTPHRRRRLQVTRRCVEKHRRHCYPRNPASVSPSSPIGSVTRKARRAAWAWLCPNSLRHFMRCCRSSVDNNLITKSATEDGLATHRGRGGRDR